MFDDLTDIIVFGIICFLIVAFFVILESRVTNLENKINGNCVYINNEFYCKN